MVLLQLLYRAICPCFLTGRSLRPGTVYVKEYNICSAEIKSLAQKNNPTVKED
jgi:hypothetical protein